MRQVLRLIGNRYGAAVSILIVIAVVVAFGKLVGGSRTPSSVGSDQGPPAVSISAPVVASSTSPVPDDGVGPEMDASTSPSMSPGAPAPESVAVDFTKAWLNHHNISAADWHKGVAKYSTKTLSDRLDGVDPGSVPADQMTGAATIADHEPSYVDVTVPCDTGTLALRIVVVDGRWLVDGVDWRRT
jgi:hypothetical protein